MWFLWTSRRLQGKPSEADLRLRQCDSGPSVTGQPVEQGTFRWSQLLASQIFTQIESTSAVGLLCWVYTDDAAWRYEL